MNVRLNVKPLTSDMWSDFAELFTASSNTSGCWCIWPRMPLGTHRPSDRNQQRMKQVVDADKVPGLLAYRFGRPVGWIALAPRRDYLRIADYGSPDAWVIGCLFVAEGARGSGVAKQLISAALEYARVQGATVIEAIPRGWRMSGSEGPGMLAPSLQAAGFTSVDPVVEGVYFRIGS